MVDRPQMILAGVTLDAPDARALADFYHRLLGWTVIQDEADWIVLGAPHGGTNLSFQTDKQYVRRVGPAGPGDQQMSLHLDIRVDDLETAAAHAVEAGATVAAFQPQDDVRVCLDPDGHPFCLFL
jgi:catechol 2,3-dioxygenase-like lactoylglutathione lyase family enzyme